MRRGDRKGDREHWQQVRVARRSVYWLAVIGAVVLGVWAPADVRLWGMLGMMILAGFLWDSQAATRFLSEIVDRLPFTKDRSERHGSERHGSERRDQREK